VNGDGITIVLGASAVSFAAGDFIVIGFVKTFISQISVRDAGLEHNEQSARKMRSAPILE
jgi:hypothetical protein